MRFEIKSYFDKGFPLIDVLLLTRPSFVRNLVTSLKSIETSGRVGWTETGVIPKRDRTKLGMDVESSTNGGLFTFDGEEKIFLTLFYIVF